MSTNSRGPRNGIADQPASVTRRTMMNGLAASMATAPLMAKATAIAAGPSSNVSTRMLARGAPDYEEARRRGVWQTSTPARYPDQIVQAHSVAEVRDVVRYARAHHTTIAVKGSGHNYTSTYLRDGGVLLDLSQLKKVTFIAGGTEVLAQPGITNGELCATLTAQGRAFPTGHHGGVGLGGYLLGGGMGWNGETWGQFACFSVAAVDVMTTAGVTVRANDHSHPDLFWAARGAGPLFCGIATEFRLKTYVAPPQILSSQFTYPLSSSGAIARWLQRIADERPSDLDLFLLMLSEDKPKASGGIERRQTALVYILCYAADKSAAEESLRRVGRAAPSADILDRQELAPVSFADLYAESLTGPARRVGADTAWTNDPIQATELLARHFESVPSAATVGIVNYRAQPRLPAEAAFSVSGRGFVQWLGQWEGAEHDAENQAWVAAAAQLLLPCTVGAYINECDILRRPERLKQCLSPAHLQRLRQIRAQYDPDNLLPPPVAAA
jgi:FAD/FMN-containing dehydrogenase